MPIQGDRPVIQAIVIADLHDRWQVGVERYQTIGLQVGNGRDMSRDALEEAQDLLIYMTGVRERDREIVDVLRHLLDEIHRDQDGACAECGGAYPCHTAVDITRVLGLLGVRDVTAE